MFEPGSKAPDGHIGKSVEPAEIDVEVHLQLSLIIRFKFCLVRRKKVTNRIVNQIERKVRPAAVPEAVQELKGAYAGIKHAVAPLSIDVLELVTRHRGNDFHVVDCEKVGQPLVTWFKEDREVTAVNDGFDLGHFP